MLSTIDTKNYKVGLYIRLSREDGMIWKARVFPIKEVLLGVI